MELSGRSREGFFSPLPFLSSSPRGGEGQDKNFPETGNLYSLHWCFEDDRLFRQNGKKSLLFRHPARCFPAIPETTAERENRNTVHHHAGRTIRSGQDKARRMNENKKSAPERRREKLRIRVGVQREKKDFREK